MIDMVAWQDYGHRMVASGSDSEPWRAAWAKAPKPEPGQQPLWLPLHIHLTDAGEIARHIWRDWLGDSVRSVIAQDASEDQHLASKIVQLAAATHDWGKLTPAFAGQVPEMRVEMAHHDFRWNKGAVPEDSRALPHAIAGYVLLLRYLEARGVPAQNAEAFAVIAGSHHGVPPNDSEISAATTAHRLLGTAEWDDARATMLTYVIHTLDLGPALEALARVRLSDASQLLITAVVIMADWIASNADLFPLLPRFEDTRDLPADRAERAWQALDLPRPWLPTDEALTMDATDLLRTRFGVPYEANEVQRLALEAARAMGEPGLLLIESVMGSGKTEASLLAAEVLARKFSRSGVFYGLPTRATADAMFHRLLDWWHTVPDVNDDGSARGVALRHSSAPLNDEYRALPRRDKGGHLREADAAPLAGGRMVDVGIDVEYGAAGSAQQRRRYNSEIIAHHWTSGRKQASFAETVVATIDHQLLAALSSRHVMLRHLGLARQIVILDEVHSADTWMEIYLERALEWLARYGAPVIVLSATLSPDRRKGLVEAYERGRRAARPVERSAPMTDDPTKLVSTRPAQPPAMPNVADSDRYPLVTTLVAGAVHQVSADPPAGGTVQLDWLADDDDALVAELDPVISTGGCVLVVCNTVSRAVKRYRYLRQLWGEHVTLAHSRFIAHDRVNKDTWLRKTFGPGDNTDRGERIVVATQVAEQSLDIDFDLLVTDLAPIDLVLQRIGRLHRHQRQSRPKPARGARCLIAGMKRLPTTDAPPILDYGGSVIYSAHLLFRSAALILDRIDSARPLHLPDDVPPLVRSCYGTQPLGPPSWQLAMAQAHEEFDKAAAMIARDAQTYRLRAPNDSRLIVGLLQANAGEAETNDGVTKQVRQADGGFEVIVIRQDEDGLSLLPSFKDNRIIPTGTRPDRDTVRLLARSIARVPSWVTQYPRDTEQVLRDLASRYYPAWQKDHVIAGQLILILDTEGTGTMGPFTVRYDTEIGLEVTRG